MAISISIVFVSALSLYALFVFGDDFSRFVKYTKIPENLRIKFNELIRIDSRTSYNVSKELYVTINERGAGYGNRMYTILSGLTIALLTQRKPYIDFPQIEGYIREPEDWWSFRALNGTMRIIDPSKANFWKTNKDIPSIIKTRVEFAEKTVVFGYNGAYFFEVCANPYYYERLYELGLVKLETIRNARIAIDSITNVTSNIDLIDSIYLIGYEVGGNLLNKYWIPENSISAQIDKYVEQNFKSNLIIAFQVRTQFLSAADNYNRAVDNFIECAKTIERFARSDRPVKWFISSDNAEIVKQIDVKNPNRTLQGFGEIGHVANKASSYGRAIVDIALLSRADYLVVTGSSTFGFLASMMSGRLNYVINGRDKCRLMSMGKPGNRGPLVLR